MNTPCTNNTDSNDARTDDEATEPITPADTSKKDRTDLWASISVFALTSAIVLYGYVGTLLHQLGDGIVAARVEFDEIPPPILSSPAGIELKTAATTTVEVSTDALSPVTVGYLRVADALQSLGYLVALGLLSWLVLRFARGRLFDRGAIRLVWVASGVAIGTIIVPMIPRILGTNMMIRDIDMFGALNGAPLGSEFWYGYVFCMALSAVAVALRIGNRMARDNEGLV